MMMQHARLESCGFRLAAAAFGVLVTVGVAGVSAGDVPFTERLVDSGPSAGVSALFLADVNGDDRTDILAAFAKSDLIRWYENNGDSPPSFSSRVVASGLDIVRDVIAADVDGDGDTDVLGVWVVTVGWFENDGSDPPSFTQHVITTEPNIPRSTDAADIDGDGDIDVLAASFNDNKIAWYRNNGGSPPTFSQFVITTDAEFAESVYAADVDADGDMDVLSASTGDDTIAWYENNGGGFPVFTKRIITTGAVRTDTVFASDLDGDGDTDVLTGYSNNTLAWYENNGGSPPTFTERVISTNVVNAGPVFAADVDGDGDTDVLAAAPNDASFWFENDGGSPPDFIEHLISDVDSRDIAAADLDGDGDTDVVTGATSGSAVQWYDNESANVINQATGNCFPTFDLAIEFAHDGDTLVAHAELFPIEPAIDFRGKALTLLSRVEIVQPEGGSYELADGASLEAAIGADMDLAGDLVVPPGADADVAADFVTVARTGAVTAETGARLFVESGALVDGNVTLESGADAVFGGDVTFRPSVRSLTTERVVSTGPDGPESVFAADVDGDGDTDVLSASAFDDTIAWYESDGGVPPGFTPHVISTGADDATAVFAADVDGDGDTDVLSASNIDDTIAWYENDGGFPPAFTERVISTGADSAQSVFAADVDGDGDIDVLSASLNDDTIAWYESDGGAPPAFTERVITTAAAGAASVFAADVDGDGDTDVLSAAFLDDRIAWYENDGGTPPVFTVREVAAGVDGAASVFAADVDGDGDTDVLSASLDDDTIAWYENDGLFPPVFTERVISTDAVTARSVFAADADGDGDVDVFSAAISADTIAWYENDGQMPPVFTERLISAEAGSPFSVFAADVDGDGDTDVLAALRTDDTIAWYENDSSTTSLAADALLAAAGDVEIRRATVVAGGRVSAGGAFLNTGSLRLTTGVLEAGGGLTNGGVIEGAGDLLADVANDGDVTLVADTLASGDYYNTGTTTIQNGTLTILGTLTNDGVIIGDLSGGLPMPGGGGRAVGDQPSSSQSGRGFFVRGDFEGGPQASLLMASEEAVVRAGGAFDVAIDESARYHMARAELRMVALGGQTLEVMSLDRGADPAGLDRELPGSFPIRKLRLGPTSTRVTLADAHDNAGDGQSSCEAIYVESLVVDAGAALITNGCRVYYVDAQIDGVVDDPANVIPIADCPEDLSGNGVVDFADILLILGAWGLEDRPEDIDGSGTVDFGDVLLVLAAWGACE